MTISPKHASARHLLPLVLLVAGLTACATSQAPRPAAPAAAAAPAAQAQAVANFSPALRCMDSLLLDHGARDFTVIVEDLTDPTRGASAITKDTLIAAVADMTQRSRAIRVVAAAAPRRDQFAVTPQYTLRGSINLLDNQSAPLNGANAAPAVLGVDLTLLTTQDLSVVPGVAARNSVVLFKQGRAYDGRAQIRKFGVTYGLASAGGDVVALSSRALVELASIELFGRLARVPYWTCLGLTDAHEGVAAEMQDWYDAMAVQPVDLIKYFQGQLRARRVYEGPIDGTVSPQLKDAVARYREALGLSREPKLSLDFFKAYLAANHQEIEARVASPAVAPAAPAVVAAPAPAAVAPIPAAPAPTATLPPPPAAAAAAPLALRIAPTNESRRFAPGEKVELTIHPNRNAHVYCFLQDEDRKIRRFFPNRFQRDSRVLAGEGLQLPGRMRFELAMNANGHQETVACFATERDVLARLPAGVNGGDFDVLPVASIDQVRSAFAKVANGALAQDSFHLQPR
jgi:hypothetical protein